MLNDITMRIGLNKHGRDCEQVPPDGTLILQSKSTTSARGSASISPPKKFKHIPRTVS
jgi:hypothetical protein